jgi:succinate dehydrogenase / fumarate reductase flavoprotein subunit
MKGVMTSYAGLFRSEAGLLSAAGRMKGLREDLKKTGIRQKELPFNYELIHLFELEGMLHLAEVIIKGALARLESRGSHFRVDYPRRDDVNWLRHTLAYRTPEGPRLDLKEVKITSYAPQERTY